MPYKDIQKKTLYQRNYMRKRRALTKQLKLNSTLVRPSTSNVLDLVEYGVDGNVLYDF
jgi:hypothetical protein